VYHAIVFNADVWLDLERSPRDLLERVLFLGGCRCRAQLRPHILETAAGPVEAADLYFEDGTTARGVPFECFAFVY
jgi:hypothetical protein